MDLLELERKLWDANLAGDGEFYAKLLRDDAVVVSPWGTMTKEQAVPGITANHNPYTRYEITEPLELPLGPDGGLITYRVEVHGKSDAGEPFSHTVFATSAYAREGGDWRAVFHQQTLVA